VAIEVLPECESHRPISQIHTEVRNAF